MPLQKQWNIAGIAKAALLSYQGWLCLPLNESFCSTGAEVWKATNHWKQYINKKTTVLGTKITRNHTVLRTKCPRIMHFLRSLVHPDDHNSGWKWLIDTKVSLFLYFPVVLFKDGLWATPISFDVYKDQFQVAIHFFNINCCYLFSSSSQSYIHQKWNWTKNTIQIFQGWIRTIDNILKTTLSQGKLGGKPGMPLLSDWAGQFHIRGGFLC